MKDPVLDIAVIGGDRRESAAAVYLLEQGAAVRVFGPPHVDGLAGAMRARSLAEAVDGAQVIVGPVRGLDADNHLHGMPGVPGLWLTDAVINKIAPDTWFFIGWANNWLRERAAERGFRLVDLMERDDFAILNAIPTAEGAIQKAMEESDITIFDSSCLVLGFGRTGQTLAERLKGLGAQVTVIDRNPAHLARAAACGHRAYAISRLADVVHEASFIFNTIPALVLDRHILGRTRAGAIILDIASAPGGTDFAAAEGFGRKAFLLPGLPGRVAPRTAGRYLAQVVWNTVMESLIAPGCTR